MVLAVVVYVRDAIAFGNHIGVLGSIGLGVVDKQVACGKHVGVADGVSEFAAVDNYVRAAEGGGGVVATALYSGRAQYVC